LELLSGVEILVSDGATSQLDQSLYGSGHWRNTTIPKKVINHFYLSSLRWFFGFDLIMLFSGDLVTLAAQGSLELE